MDDEQKQSGNDQVVGTDGPPPTENHNAGHLERGKDRREKNNSLKTAIKTAQKQMSRAICFE